MKVNNLFLKSVGITTIVKPIGMIVSFLYTPYLLSYLGEEKYGIWVTILSVISWINYFDVGIGNGLRNCLALEIGRSDEQEAKKSVSTAYTIITIITIAIYCVVMIAGYFADFNKLFNTSENITIVLFISFTLLCVNFVISLQKTESFAIQKPEYVSFTELFTQVLNLFGVVILSNFVFAVDKLVSMAFLFGFSNIIMNLVFTIVLWAKRKFLIPSVKYFDKNKLGVIGALGIKFFVIQIAMIVLYTTDSLIITKLYNASQVTPYNSVYKLYGAVNSIFAAMLSPFWSKFTVANDTNDIDWIKRTLKKLFVIWGVLSTVMICSIPFFQAVSDIWLRYHLTYEPYLVISMVVYYILMMHSSILSSYLNGVGNIDIQVIANVVAAAINIPVSIFLAEKCNLKTTGVCLGTVISLLIINIILEIQVRKIMKIRNNIER